MGNYKSNNKKATRIVFSVVALTFLSSMLILSALVFPSIPSNAKTAGAEVGVTVKEFIKLAVDTSSLALRDGSNNTIINPSAAGTMISGDVNLAVTTNTVKGYTLSAYTADSSTSMSNSNPSVTTNISSIATASGYNTSTGISDLAANTWGFKKSAKNDTATGNWFGVGANSGSGTIISSTDSDDADFCENLSYPLANTGCNSSTYDTYNIKFGAKLTSALPAGTYTNNVVFSAVAKSEGTKYTLNFNANNANATGTMNPRVMLQGSTIAIPATMYSLSGYSFLGWALTSSATTPTYTVGQTVAVNDLISAATTAGQSINSLTLYAIWAPITGNMQSWTGCNSLSTGQSVYLMDTRDNKAYAVKKLPDGKCWMMQNLTIGMDGAKTLTPADTNIDDGRTYYLPPAGKQGFSTTIDNSSTLTATTTANFTTGNDNRAKTQFRAKDSSIANDSDTGYYNFYTATLGFSYYNDGKTSGSSTRDICPKGWRLPKTTDNGNSVASGSPAEFTTLAKTYNPSASWTNAATSASYNTSDSTIGNSMYLSAASPLATTTQNNYAGFSYAGLWSSTNTSASAVGSYGYYWSSSVYLTSSGYYLNFNSSNIYPQNNSGKYNGYAVRCVAKDPTMQDFDASANLPNVGDSAELVDTRDGKKYTVKRLPDGKVWMMQNLTIGSDGAKTLTAADTNIDNGTTYYLPPAGKQGSSTIDDSSTLTATDTADFASSSSTDQHAKTQFRTKNTSYTNDSDTGYYNFYTATLGFSYYNDGKTSGSSTRDICPKGWRLPWTSDSGTTRTTTADFYVLATSYNSSASWTNKPTGSSTTNPYTSDSTIKNSMYLNAASPLATTTQNNYAGFSYAGYWSGTNTSASDVGSYGYYWSSSVYNTSSGYRLSFDSSSISPQNNGSKYGGRAVRCVAQ